MKDDISSATLVLPDVICHVMTFHPGPITKFTLDIRFYEESTPNIDNLIYFISKKGIQHLVLKIPWPSSPEKQYSLPSSFFTCSQLRHLALGCFSVQLPPPDFKGFDRLISLKLHGVTISSKFLQSLVSCSPFLEQLVLRENIMDAQAIEINAPMLKSFYIRGNLRSIYLKNVPLLEKLTLWDGTVNDLDALGDFDAAKFFYSCYALEHLHLNDSFLCLLRAGEAAGDVPTRVPFVLHSVKHLSLFGFCLSRVNISLEIFEALVSAVCLLRSFPNLQYLEWKVMIHPFDDDKLFDVERFSGMELNHLREVKYESFRGIMREIEFIKLLLAKSPVLVRMLLMLCRTLEGSARDEMLAALSKCKPASPTAEVVVIFSQHESHRVRFV